MGDDSAVVAALPLEPISLNVLELIKSSQAANGLRHNDHQRYRRYCTRRLRRIRKTINFTYGRGKTFVKREVDADDCADARYLLILLYNGERAWSYAMQLRDDMADGDNSRIKFSLMRRLIRAAEHAEKFSAVCHKRADARTCLEAEAYAAHMAGTLGLEKEEWETALAKFSTASDIYAQLAKVGPRFADRIDGPLRRVAIPLLVHAQSAPPPPCPDPVRDSSRSL